MKSILKNISLFFILSSAAWAFTQINHTYVELVSEETAIKAGRPFFVGLRLEMEENWHTYWKNPGDSGFPTTITWNLPQGFSASPIHWPFPDRMDEAGLTTFGYSDEVTLLIQITPPDAMIASHVDLKAKVQWLECEKICVPGETEVSLTLPVSLNDPERDAMWEKNFQETRLKIPVKDDQWEMRVLEKDSTYILKIRNKNTALNINQMDFFPEEDDVINHAAPQQLQQKKDEYTLTVSKNPRTKPQVPVLKGILVMNVAENPHPIVLEFEAGVAPFVEEIVQMTMVENKLTFVWACLFAFLGGIILNLMPCVFPVLSVKILNIFYHSHNPLESRIMGCLYALGIVITFCSLAVLLLLLRLAGHQLGWGFQFQSPLFVTAMAYLFFILALNLWGLFEIGLSLTTVKISSGSSLYVSSFLNGILAVIVASPCTAPFMGSAIAFSLAQPLGILFTVFFFLGLGMAFPFLIFAFIPSLLKSLPKPGKWMDVFKKFLAFPLMATVVWLLWVLGEQKGFMSIVYVLGGMLFIALGVWLYSLRTSVKKMTIIYVGIVVCVLGVMWCTQQSLVAETLLSEASESSQGEIKWQNYSKALIDEAHKENKIVFLDFTASWCLTCQVNEKLVLSNSKVIEILKKYDIMAVKADWTNYDADITEALASYGKRSIPVYVILYGTYPNRKSEILPEIITPGIVVEKIETIINQERGKL